MGGLLGSILSELIRAYIGIEGIWGVLTWGKKIGLDKTGVSMNFFDFSLSFHFNFTLFSIITIIVVEIILFMFLKNE